MTEIGTRERTVIKCDPRWFLLIYEGEIKQFYNETIIAWQIERYERPYPPLARVPEGEKHITCEVTPITVQGFPCKSYSSIWAIQEPDGHITFVDDETFSDEREALEHAEELYQVILEMKAENKE